MNLARNRDEHLIYFILDFPLIVYVLELSFIPKKNTRF